MTTQAVKTEIESYWALQSQVVGRTIAEAGLQIYCAPQVMSPNNRVTRCLGQVIAAERARRVLDLGCGTGVLALIAARHCEQVMGVDIDPLAVICARLNARLNRLPNVCFLIGSGFQPVQGVRFDLIVSNPPFYPAAGLGAPPSQLCAPTGEGLLTALIVGARQHLFPGGRVLFATSSLSDNGWVRQTLEAHRYMYCCRILRQGHLSSQDLFLWEIFHELTR